ncbi:hypothetical protein P153DRAFT_360313 [Dothidotthia symphoricarpi CBS 119687]|uniref:Uncharacterized protein n=1 Tax=Dothidotthia symphoricarpi CBS 119687 TaxID=1392245 RepID=A0A6A6A1C2_9PLEO|nr:uncharacterized protein P153DRAFT_360313 [Dothidotthia symphoricarpi CBS 119687]KAF2125316.1 hypothetical protein P153DRAFT_360313 [Dothidotthia symphoricarpi CBS 119687]
MATYGLFVLPPELRLQVYRHLIETCLHDGTPSEAGGLYRSCRLIHREMEHEYISKVRILFESQQTWIKEERLLSRQHTTLGIDMAHELDSSPALDGVTVVLPVPKINELCKSREPYVDEPYPCLEKVLYPILHMPLSLLTVYFGFTKDRQARDVRRSFQFLHDLFFGVGFGEYTPKADRIVVRLGAHHGPESVCSWISVIAGNEVASILGEPTQDKSPRLDVKRVWMSEACAGDIEICSIGFDFKADLERPKDQVMENNVWDYTGKAWLSAGTT